MIVFYVLFVGRGAPDITVLGQRAVGRFIDGPGHLVLQNPFQEAIGVVGMFHRHFTGLDELFVGGQFGELQYALAAPVELFGVLVLSEQGLDILVEFLGVAIPLLHIIGGASLFVISVVRAQMFLFGGVARFPEAPGVYGEQLSVTAEDPDDATGIDHPGLFADVGVGYAIVMFVAAQIDMVVLCHLQALVVFNLEVRWRQGPQGMLFVGNELFLP